MDRARYERRLNNILQEIRVTSRSIGPEIVNGFINMIQLHERSIQLTRAGKANEVTQTLTPESIRVLNSLNAQLRALNLYCRISTNVNMGGRRSHLYMKSFRIVDTHTYRADDGRNANAYLVREIDNIALTSAESFVPTGADYAIILLDNVDTRVNQIERMFGPTGFNLHQHIENRLTDAGRIRLAALRVRIVDLAHREFGDLNKQQRTDKIRELFEQHEIRHVLDNNRFTAKDPQYVESETSAFLAELISGVAPYWSLADWAMHVYMGGEHDRAARRVFEELVNKASEKGFTNETVTLEHVSFTQLIGVLTILSSLTREQITGLAKEIYPEVMGFDFVDAALVTQDQASTRFAELQAEVDKAMEDSDPLQSTVTGVGTILDGTERTIGLNALSKYVPDEAAVVFLVDTEKEAGQLALQERTAVSIEEHKGNFEAAARAARDLLNEFIRNQTDIAPRVRMLTTRELARISDIEIIPLNNLDETAIARELKKVLEETGIMPEGKDIKRWEMALEAVARSI